MTNFEDELDKVYAPEINMFSCMDDGNCWNGQATIEERCYFPIGYRPSPDDDPSNGVQNILIDVKACCLACILSFLVSLQ